MPELPDVEVRKRMLESTSLGKKIVRVSVLEKRVLGENTTPAILSKGLKDSVFKSVKRRGKYLLIRTNRDKILLIHLGMSGDLIFREKSREKPKWSRVEFYFGDGSCLHYINIRLIGKVALFETLDDSKIQEIAKLGPEPLERAFTFAKFASLVRSHSTSIHQLLMTQELIAGIGNIYSDEITFQAGVLPFRNTETLTEAEIKKLYDEMKRVLRTAIKLGADLDPYPERFLIPNRIKGGTCPRDGTPVKSKKIGGRTSYFCPACQK